MKINEPKSSPAKASQTSSVMVGVPVIIVAFIVVMAIAAFSRDFFNYGTETDFLGGFISEAQRFLNGEPLAIRFHPPLYSMLLGLAYLPLGNWMTAGLTLSLTGAAASLVCSFTFFRRAYGPGAAVGSVLALLVSPTFVVYTAATTSDVFSLGLHLATLLTVYNSWQRRTPQTCLLAGLLLGISLLTRTNNIGLLSLLLVFFLPVASRPLSIHLKSAIKPLALVAVGLCLPVSAWVGYAKLTGAPIAPTLNYQNLALTYFIEGDRVGGDSRAIVAEEFSSTAEVLTRNPDRMAKIYARDFANMVVSLVQRESVLPFYLVLAGAACAVAILIHDRDRRPLTAVLFVNIAGFIMLLNLKAYDDRFYLFLLPFLGAALGYTVEKFPPRLADRRLRMAGGSLLAMVAALAIVKVAFATRFALTDDSSEDAFAAAGALKAAAESDRALIIARKPHVGYYAGMERHRTPQAGDVDELCDVLTEWQDRFAGPLFLFHGAEERRTRPQYSALGNPDSLQTHRLRLIGQGSERGGWFLYQLEPDKTDAAPGPDERE